jgi:hypothetical protein
MGDEPAGSGADPGADKTRSEQGRRKDGTDEQAKASTPSRSMADGVGVVLDVYLPIHPAGDEHESVDLDRLLACQLLDVVPVCLGGVRVRVGRDVKIERSVVLRCQRVSLRYRLNCLASW